jgi:hypothetical protein
MSNLINLIIRHPSSLEDAVKRFSEKLGTMKLKAVTKPLAFWQPNLYNDEHDAIVSARVDIRGKVLQ